MTCHTQLIFSMINSWFLNKTIKVRRQWGTIFKVLTFQNNPVNQQFSIWQGCTLKMKEKLRHFQIKKNWRLAARNCPSGQEGPSGEREGH